MSNGIEHPGAIIRKKVLPKAGTTIELAKMLGINRVNLSRLLNGKASLSTRVAFALESNGCGSARRWLLLQLEYDLATEKLSVRMKDALRR
jgi:addiction module HigA family antidote